MSDPIRDAFNAGARAFMLQDPIAREFQEFQELALTSSYNAWQREQMTLGHEPSMQVHVSFAVWFDATDHVWKAYGTGWERSSRHDPRVDVEQTLENISRGEQVHWRTVHAILPLPEEPLIEVVGHTVDPENAP